MAEICLLSNQSSSLYASSKASGGSDKSAYIYDMKQSSVNKFRERFVRTPLNGANFASTATCEIPAFGVLKQMVLRVDIKWTDGTGTDVPMISRSVFSQLIDQVSIKNSSREIQVLYGDCIKYLVYNMEEGQSKKWRLAGCDDLLCADKTAYLDGATAVKRYKGKLFPASTNERTLTCYCVLPFSFFEGFGSSSQYKNCLNTRFLERLSLDVKFNPSNKVVNEPTAGAWTYSLGTTELLCSFDVIQDKELQEIESANFSLSQPLAMVVGNWNKTRAEFTATAADNTFEIQLFNTDLAHSLLIVCRKVNDTPQLTSLTDAINQSPGEVRYRATEGFGLTESAKLVTATAGGDAASAGAAANVLQNAVYQPHTNLHAVHVNTIHNNAGAIDTVAKGLGVSRPGADLCKIDEIVITSAGREIYKSSTHEEGLLLTNTDKRGASWFSSEMGKKVGETADLEDPMGCSPYYMYCVPFGDDDNCDAIRGCLSMKNLNSVKVSVRCKNLQAPATTSARYEVCVYVRKYSALSIESNSGRVSVAVST